ncbi:MAG: Tad domain-containing protein [Pseudomonadota bacterium]
MRRKMHAMIRQEKGSITMYVVVMSILLMGAMGLVLDSGRVYATHSQMQAFADHIALAAANELDGSELSIERATKVAYGLIEDSEFLQDSATGQGELSIATLHFFSDLNETSGLQWELAESQEHLLMSTTKIETSVDPEMAEAAKYVTAVVEQRDVRSLAHLMNSIVDALASNTYADDLPDGAPARRNRASVAANATAGLEVQSCAELNNLVFCNPWEGMDLLPGEPETDENGMQVERIDQENLVGRSLMYFAPNFATSADSREPVDSHQSIYDWGRKNQLYTLSDPVADSAGVCTMEFVQRYFDFTGGNVGDSNEYLAARDRCLMARAEVEAICYSENTIGIRPADGPSVAAAVNIAFDIYNEPMNRVITATDSVGTTGLSLSEFFEPDALVAHAFERMVDLDLDGDIDNDDYEEFGHLNTDSEADENSNAFSLIDFEYAANPAPNMQHLPNSLDGLGGVHPCHEGTLARATGNSGGDSACAIDFVGDDSFGATSRYLNSVANYYEVNSRSIRRNVRRGPWYDIYQFERAQLAAGGGVLGNGATDVSHANGGATDGPEEDPYLGRRGDNIFADVDPETENNDEHSLKVSPLDPLGQHSYAFNGLNELHAMTSFAARTGRNSLVNAGKERRKLQSAFVNCQAAAAEEPDADGIYQAEIAMVVDVFLPQPAGIYCGEDGVPRQLNAEDPTTTTVSLQTCDINDSVETRLFIETIDESDQQPIERFTAQLVR